MSRRSERSKRSQTLRKRWLRESKWSVLFRWSIESSMSRGTRRSGWFHLVRSKALLWWTSYQFWKLERVELWEVLWKYNFFYKNVNICPVFDLWTMCSPLKNKFFQYMSWFFLSMAKTNNRKRICFGFIHTNHCLHRLFRHLFVPSLVFNCETVNSWAMKKSPKWAASFSWKEQWCESDILQ